MVYLAYTTVVVVGVLLLVFQYNRNQRLRMDVIHEQSLGDVRLFALAASTLTSRVDALAKQAEGSIRIGDRHQALREMLDGVLRPAQIQDQVGYGMDSLPEPLDGRLDVNVNGLGRVQDVPAGVRTEIAMAVALEPGFHSTVEYFPAVTQAYYVSDRGFRVGSPRVPTSERAINPAYRYREYFARGTPEVNPERRQFWTAPYVDSWSSEQMVTLAQPVYADTTFIGVVCLDITLERLNIGMQRRNERLGTSFVVLGDQTVLATSSEASMELASLKRLSAVLPDALESVIDAELQDTSTQFRQVGDHFLLTLPIDHTPWHFVVHMEGAALRLSTLRVMIPELAVSVVLIAMMIGVEFFRRSRSELAATKQIAVELATKLSRYVAPQVVESVFSGRKDVIAHTERKKLTVFFSDIKDFTGTTEGLEAEDLAALLNDYLNEMTQIAFEHGATIDKYIGDAIVAFFGDPESLGTEEDAMQCVRMAIAMQRRMHGFRSKWNELGIGKPFHMRIGINTGYCNVGNFGSDERLDYTIIGSEVNKASRLESACEPDGILVSEETYALVRGMVEVKGAAPVQMKGFDQPVTAYQVTDLIAEDDDRYVADYRRGVRLFIDAREVPEDERDSVIAKLRAAIDRLVH